MEIRDVDKDGNLVKKEPEAVKEPTTLQAPVADVLETAVNQMFQLETDSQKSKYADKIRAITEWAKLQTKDQTPDGIKWAIRDMQLRIGSPLASESPIDYLYSYVALSSKKKEIDEKLRKYYV